jgi:hypothetical protein
MQEMTAPNEDDEDEGESRAGAIRKKVKIDPFASKKGKQLQKQGKGNNTSGQGRAPLPKPTPHESIDGPTAGSSVMKKVPASISSPDDTGNDHDDLPPSESIPTSSSVPAPPEGNFQEKTTNAPQD